ncbi:MAG: ATP-binding cassette domain-containing protein [Pseudomonadales bacterium]
MIRVEQLHKSFGAVQAVQDVSFGAADGRITALLGPNGAGKSTTLRILATVLRADRGQAWIDGHDVARDAVAVRRRIGVLPHAAGLYDRLTARENIAYYGELHGLKRAPLAARIDALVERLEMGEFAHRRVAGFSQGQRIKVALARALVHDPRTVLLDEPTNGLDVMATRALREIIRGLRAEGRCVLFSSHVMQEVASLCDDVVIIGHGRVLFDGHLEALRARTGETDLEEAFIRVIDAHPEAERRAGERP